MLPATETDPSWLSRERGGDELMHQRLLNICLHNPIHQPPFPPTEMQSHFIPKNGEWGGQQFFEMHPTTELSYK